MASRKAQQEEAPPASGEESTDSSGTEERAEERATDVILAEYAVAVESGDAEAQAALVAEGLTRDVDVTEGTSEAAQQQNGYERRREERGARFTLPAYCTFVDALAAHLRSSAIAWAEEGTEELPRLLPFIYSQQPEYAGEWKVFTDVVRGKDGGRAERTEERWIPAKRSTRKDNWDHIAKDVGFVLNEQDKKARAAKRAAGAIA